MTIELTEYLTANAFKCLSQKAKELGLSIEGMLPELKICSTWNSLMFYYKDVVIFQRVENKWYDAEMNEMNTKISILSLWKAIELNRMRKVQKSIVVITFDKVK